MRPRRRFEILSRISRVGASRPLASKTIAQVRPAISQALRPAFTESKTIARSRSAYRVCLTNLSSLLRSAPLSGLACLPAIATRPFLGDDRQNAYPNKLLYSL